MAESFRKLNQIKVHPQDSYNTRSLSFMMVLVYQFTNLEKFTKVIGVKGKDKVMEDLSKLMAVSTTENGEMTKNMVSENTKIQLKITNMKVVGPTKFTKDQVQKLFQI